MSDSLKIRIISMVSRNDIYGFTNNIFMKQKNITKIILVALIGLTLLLAGCTSSQQGISEDGTAVKVTLYKSASCGCCTGHAAELRSNGFDVDVITTADMASIKKQYNIPSNMESCHTAVIGNYFIEGHMPIEAITKLLEEQPDLDGIALPNMPAGSPGMPGVKKEPFVIYGIKNGEISEFTVI